MNPKTKKFQALQRKWYKKLENTGFEDIEQNESKLKNWTSARLQAGRNNGNSVEQTMVFNESKEEYYRLAGFFLYDHKFLSKQDHLVWKLHSEGVPIRDISKVLKALKYSVASTQVKDIIHRLRTIMLSLYRGSHE